MYRSSTDAYRRERGSKNHGSAKVGLIKRINDSLLDAKSGEGRS